LRSSCRPGFANPDYSNLLPALRAAEKRIRRFVESGGRLLVFGARMLPGKTLTTGSRSR